MRPTPPTARRNRQTDIPVPMPLSGMDAQMSSFEMSPQFAEEMLNAIPIGGEIHVREGFETKWTVGASQDPTIMSYNFLGTKSILTASANAFRGLSGNVLDTYAGADRWSWDTLSNHLIAVNGTEVRNFDGTVFSTPAWTGDVPPTPWVGVCTHNERAYFWRAGSLDFWYGDGVGAIAGPATEFPLSNLGNISGEITTMASWTVDAGHGMNDVLVIITTEGDVVLYEGLDPSDPNDWRLTGRYKMPHPINSDRITQRFGTDLLILSTEGVVSLSAIMRSAEASAAQTFSARIDPELLGFTQFPPDIGWDLALDPAGKMILVNVPSGDDFIQYGYSLKNKAWFTMGGIDAACWVSHSGRLWFVRQDGAVCQFGDVHTDDGAYIEVKIKLARNMAGTSQSVSVISIYGDSTGRAAEAVITMEDEYSATSGSSRMSTPVRDGSYGIVTPVTGRGDALQATLLFLPQGAKASIKKIMARASASVGKV